VSSCLATVPLLEVVGEYSTGKAAIAGIMNKRPDVALIDLGLPDLPGEEVIRRIVQKGCETEALVLTIRDDDDSLFQALQTGAVGYIVKGQASLSEIVQAIQEVKNGGAPMSQGIARRVLKKFRTIAPRTKSPCLQELTLRELEILEHCARGFSARKMARLLDIEYETVRSHQKTIYSKLQVHSALEAAAVFRGEKVRGEE
jgi:DNA-binding NarL/FixJ family response regulator